MIVTLSDDYGYVLLAAVMISIEVILIGFIFPGMARKKTFTEKFMKENFGQMHKDAFGTDIKMGGYPDTGTGFYSRSLTYRQWYEYSNNQRAHQNFVEWIASSILLLLVAGLYFPIYAAICGAGIFVGRLFFAIGYAKVGPAGRVVGVLFNDLAFLGLIILSVWACLNWICGKTA